MAPAKITSQEFAFCAKMLILRYFLAADEGSRMLRVELGGQLAKCLKVVENHFFSDTNVKLSSIALMIKGPSDID